MKQYRLLERKVTDRKSIPTTNESFLRSCDIRVQICTDPLEQVDRLHELALRTNQLNFTKRRPTRTDFESMLRDPEMDAGYVRVADRYGDYGSLWVLLGRSPKPNPP